MGEGADAIVEMMASGRYASGRMPRPEHFIVQGKVRCEFCGRWYKKEGMKEHQSLNKYCKSIQEGNDHGGTTDN